ncbi:MAG: T9SS type A sorting domain-containing protein [Bacteroidales bacterium]|nr:T9SS type A sorting domain-containing protein [Bacteroidales bacterium]MCF8391489.1 T9SS type A sorting domain-containing protein [Bacteroidales bacterium]
MKKLSIILILLVGIGVGVIGQNSGDWRTNPESPWNNNDWNNDENWQTYFMGIAWLSLTNQYPGYNGNISTQVNILNGHNINANNNIQGAFGGSIIIETGGSLQCSGYAINGGSASTYFPTVTIDGTLTTDSYINATTFSVGSAGSFTTSYAGTNGWWNSTYSPTTTTLGGSIEFSGTSQIIPNISGQSYHNLTISGTSTLSSGTTSFTGELEITSGNTLTINTGSNLLLESSSATNTASLINYGTINGTNTTANIEVQRYQSGSEWHLISSPVSGYAINTFVSDNNIDTSPNEPKTPTNYAMTYYVGAIGWDEPYPIGSVPTSDFVPAKGYMVGVVSPNETLSYTGVIRTSNVSYALTAPSGDVLNCVGNPFTSALSVTSNAIGSSDYFLSSTNTDVLDESSVGIWVYDPEANSDVGGYTLYSSTEGEDYIPVGQGFFVKSRNPSTGSIEFNSTMQTHNTTSLFYKKSQKASSKNYPVVYLSVENTESKSSTKVYFIENMTAGLDPSWDIACMGLDTTFQVYTKLINDYPEKFYIQCLPNSNYSNISVPIGLDYVDGGYVTFSVESVTVPAEGLAILEDRELGVFTDLKASGAHYSVVLPANTTGTGRFFLHTFNPQTVDTDMDDLQNITIFAFDKEIIIQGEFSESTNVKVYDLSGRMVLDALLNDNYRNSIDAKGLIEGVYIVHLQVGNQVKTSKLFLK